MEWITSSGLTITECIDRGGRERYYRGTFARLVFFMETLLKLNTNESQ